jgi:EAL domain-containing protein (putative c-di-GMP-specific phosphodiesterase class I)
VENIAQLQALRALQVESAQGYWFSRPLDAERFGELVHAQKAFALG